MAAHRSSTDPLPDQARASVDSAFSAGYATKVARSKRTGTGRTGYLAELDRLHETYTMARTSGGAALARAVDKLIDRPAVFVGSGGALAVAQFAADLHQHHSGHVARAMTPLESSVSEFHGDSALVMFTASGRHPDAALAIRAAKRSLPSVITIVTLKQEQDLPSDLRGDRIIVVTVPCAITKDGFLATNSVLAMATALASAYAGGEGLPEKLPLTFEPFDIRPQCLVLYPPQHSCVAFDIEARLHETGLASVQLSDYRNFAHGRHAGLARHIEDTTVIALTAPEHETIARRTLDELPDGVDVRRISSKLRWPGSVLDLLTCSMRMITPAAARQQINPARPGVPLFGRKLYHLAIERTESPETALPVARKLVPMGRARRDSSMQTMVARALDEWIERIVSMPLRAVVLDYDGTCCTTEGRYSLPEPEVQAELLRLIDLGVYVGFASGRGRSLHRDLRKWVPRKKWGQIALGLYNGALIQTLDDALVDQVDPVPVLAEARDRLASGPFAHLITIEAHTRQVEVRVRSPHSWSDGALAGMVHELLERGPCQPVKVVSSAHSVDVVEVATSKRAVLDHVRANSDGEVLAIGDQGQVGGNDFELLAAMIPTLTVDRCSADPTRCWNLDESGHRGPVLLTRYLRALCKDRRDVRFRWSEG